MAGVAAAALLAITILAIRAPAYGFIAAIALFGFEGTIKMRLTVEGAPSPLAFGAGMVDLAFLASLLALLLHDRGRSLRRCWGRPRGSSVPPPSAFWPGLCCRCFSCR